MLIKSKRVVPTQEVIKHLGITEKQIDNFKYNKKYGTLVKNEDYYTIHGGNELMEAKEEWAHLNKAKRVTFWTKEGVQKLAERFHLTKRLQVIILLKELGIADNNIKQTDIQTSCFTIVKIQQKQINAMFEQATLQNEIIKTQQAQIDNLFMLLQSE